MYIQLKNSQSAPVLISRRLLKAMDFKGPAPWFVIVTRIKGTADFALVPGQGGHLPHAVLHGAAREGQPAHAGLVPLDHPVAGVFPGRDGAARGHYKDSESETH